MKISLKSADGRVFEVSKDEIKQLKQLRTMLDAYEECETTESVVLDRVDGGSLAVLLEWCQSFPDAEDFEPDLGKFTGTYRNFECSNAELTFLEHHKERLWKIADAADYLDASRLRYSALQFLEGNISRMLGHQQIGEARVLLGLPRSMKGAYRTDAYGQTAVFDKELSKELCCQLLRFAGDHYTLQRWRLISPDWDRLITSERHRIPRRLFRRVEFTPEGVVAEFYGTKERFPTLKDTSCLAIMQLNIDFSAYQLREVEDYVNSESAKLHVRQIVCRLHGKSDGQLRIIAAFLGRILCLEKLEMQIDLDQMKTLTACAVENALPGTKKVTLTVASEPDTCHDPFAVFASIRDFYKAFVGESETGSLDINFSDINLPFKDLLEAIGEWFLLYGHFNVRCTVYGVKDCSLKQLDAFASLNGYQQTQGRYGGRRYECKHTAGREMLLRLSISGIFVPNYILEWTTSRSR